MYIIIGSGSHRKIRIVQKVVERFSPIKVDIRSYAANSGVPDTPYDKQTFDGARNRASDSKINIPNADFYIGLESGLIERYGHIFEEAWAVVISNAGKEYYGYSSGLKVPDFILDKMNALKLEHSELMTIIEEEFGKLPNDTWGTYSGGTISREVSLEEALRNAFIQITASGSSLYTNTIVS